MAQDNRLLNNTEIMQDPPSDIQAERNFLGALLLDGTLLTKVNNEVGMIDVDDFASEKNQTVYKAILNRAAISDDFNPVIISDILETQGDLEKAGGRNYVLDLSSVTSPISSICDYATIIINKSKRRKLIVIAEQIVRMCYVPDGKSVNEIYDEAQGLVFKLSQENAQKDSGPKPVIPVASDIIKKIESKEYLQTSNGIPTGFIEFDSLTKGLQPGSLNIVAARPGMGKTSFAMNIVSNIALNTDINKPALVFSLEMPIEQIVMRMLSSFGRVSMSDMMQCNVTADQWHDMIRKISLLSIPSADGTDKKNKMYIDDSGDITPLELRSRARQLALEHGGLSVIMVDYIQLMRSQTKAASRSLEVGEISRSLKLLAKELEVPIIALSQLNRDVEGRKDHRPMNSDLRESGSLEQDADMILFLHREYAYTKSEEDISKALLIVSKNRNGATKDIKLQFQGEYTTFYDLDNNVSIINEDIPVDESPYGYQ